MSNVDEDGCMDVNTLPGANIVCYDIDPGEAILVEGNIYTVDKIESHIFNARVYLKELSGNFPCRWFRNV